MNGTCLNVCDFLTPHTIGVFALYIVKVETPKVHNVTHTSRSFLNLSGATVLIFHKVTDQNRLLFSGSLCRKTPQNANRPTRVDSTLHKISVYTRIFRGEFRHETSVDMRIFLQCIWFTHFALLPLIRRQSAPPSRRRPPEKNRSCAGSGAESPATCGASSAAAPAPAAVAPAPPSASAAPCRTPRVAARHTSPLNLSAAPAALYSYNLHSRSVRMRNDQMNAYVSEE